MDLEGFHFDSMDTTEEQERYCPGGFHPVAIGDMLDPDARLALPERRYRILHKLGFGSYATVWLARDIRSRWVSHHAENAVTEHV